MRISDLTAHSLPRPMAVWRWWIGELAALVPAPVQHRLAGARGRLVLLVADHGLAEIIRENAKGRESLGTVDLKAATPAGTSAAFRTATKRRAVAVRLPAEAALRKAISLPLAAERNLAQVVSFELERHTPLKRVDTYHAFQVLRREPAAKCLVVELTVAPRRTIDEIVAALRQFGVEAGCVEVAGADPIEPVSPNLLSGRPRTAGPPLARVVLGILAVIALLLGGAAIAIPLCELHAKADMLAAEAADAKRQVHESVRIQKEIDAAIGASGFLGSHKRSAPVVSNILDGLTRLLPDDTWLTALQITGNDVQITGQSGNASALIGLIDRSSEFSNPSFRSPVMQDQRTGREQFNIAAHVVRGPAQ